MSSVHEAITKHVTAQNRHLTEFLKLDARREQAIGEVVRLCEAGQPFSVDEINRVTAEINKHAAQGISPQRVYVTSEMVSEYVKKRLRS
ncbi:YpbS family protein [Paenibacillus chartarius]|uniref:YpbS family protein n=1 Tax=Paenibacillus chartarius TaxID=747481 RepID=A0ABV6DRC8_9BACL